MSDAVIWAIFWAAFSAFVAYMIGYGNGYSAASKSWESLMKRDAG